MLSFDTILLNIANAQVDGDLAQYIDALPNNKTIDEIAEEERIDIETLRYFVKCVLLGVLPFHFFVQELVDELDIVEEDAISVAKSVRKKILAPFVRQIAEMQDEAEKRFLETQDDDYRERYLKQQKESQDNNLEEQHNDIDQE